MLPVNCQSLPTDHRQICVLYDRYNNCHGVGDAVLFACVLPTGQCLQTSRTEMIGHRRGTTSVHIYRPSYRIYWFDFHGDADMDTPDVSKPRVRLHTDQFIACRLDNPLITRWDIIRCFDQTASEPMQKYPEHADGFQILIYGSDC